MSLEDTVYHRPKLFHALPLKQFSLRLRGKYIANEVQWIDPALETLSWSAKPGSSHFLGTLSMISRMICAKDEHIPGTSESFLPNENVCS